MKRSKPNAGFTLVEIMIVTTIIGLLAALALPSMMRARKHVMAIATLDCVRHMDDAIEEWILEKRVYEGQPIVTSEAATYLKGRWHDTDMLGNSFIIGVVGSNNIAISPETKKALDGVGVDWGRF